jgi:putative transposase
MHFTGCTAHPDNTWVTQQAQQMMWEWEDRAPVIRFLIRDNDKKFSQAFDTVFRSQGIDVIPTPYRALNANAYAERWIRSVRGACLDKLLIINPVHLRRVMREYIEFFNTARPHQGLDQQIPNPKITRQIAGPVRCRKVLGGIVHDYYRDAAWEGNGLLHEFFESTRASCPPSMRLWENLCLIVKYHWSLWILREFSQS